MSKQSLVPAIADACCAPWPRTASARTTRPRWPGVLKAVANPVELRLLSLIAARDEDTCVCDLLPEFDLSQPTISTT